MLVQWAETVDEGRRAVGQDTPAGLRLAETLAFFEFLYDAVVEINKRWAERREELRRAWGVD